MNSDLFIISLTKTASFSKHSPDVGILDPQNGFANSCRRLKPDIFEFNLGPVHTIPVIFETRIRCSYQDFVHWGPQDSAHIKPVIFETTNVVTRIRLDGVIQCSYQDSYTGVHTILFTRIRSFLKPQILLPGFVWTGSLQCLTRILQTGVHGIPFTRIRSFVKPIMSLSGLVWRWSPQCSYQDFVHWGPKAHSEAKRGS